MSVGNEMHGRVLNDLKPYQLAIQSSLNPFKEIQPSFSPRHPIC